MFHSLPVQADTMSAFHPPSKNRQSCGLGFPLSSNTSAYT